MKNRLLGKIRDVQRRGQKFFCAFLTLGYPSLRTTEILIRECEAAGVDILELGFPFSDPLADGPTIQFSSEAALRRGVCFADAFRLVKKIRRSGIKIPILFFSYFNPIFHFGYKKFLEEVRRAGFDGVIVPDLIPEEEKGFSRSCAAKGLSQVLLVAPTTEKKRSLAIARKSSGFIYYVSLRGVTGARKALPKDIRAGIREINRKIKKPVLVGFGVSTPDQARAFSKMSQGVIVGSAIIDRLRKSNGKHGAAINFIRAMVSAVKGER
jgi:tryptophan synthase alpha chain